MNLLVYETYESMSARAAESVAEIIYSRSTAVLCTASGDSPAGLYEKLVAHVQEKDVDISGLSFVGLDEWLGMNGTDEGSCRYHLDRQLFQPLHVQEKRILFFDGRASDPEAECARVDEGIRQLGGIDLAIVGLGMNGHVGMNEPGTPAALHAHTAVIDAVTQQVGQKYFREKVDIAGGLTLGVANLMEVRSVMLIVAGRKKADILKKVLEDDVSEARPASFLRKHPHFIVFADEEAASLLNRDK